MSLKTIIWTILIAVIVFFSAVYLGIKNNWVEDAEPKLSRSASVSQENTTGSVALKAPAHLTLDKNEKVPELIDEPAEAPSFENTLGSTELSIEDIVAQCQALTQSVGIPSAQEEQAMMECINRNSTHLSQGDLTSTNSDTLREDCDSAITQRELLSQEEIKMLVDECVASSR